MSDMELILNELIEIRGLLEQKQGGQPQPKVHQLQTQKAREKAVKKKRESSWQKDSLRAEQLKTINDKVKKQGIKLTSKQLMDAIGINYKAFQRIIDRGLFEYQK